MAFFNGTNFPVFLVYLFIDGGWWRNVECRAERKCPRGKEGTPGKEKETDMSIGFRVYG